jgi:hypothetical protein
VCVIVGAQMLEREVFGYGSLFRGCTLRPSSINQASKTGGAGGDGDRSSIGFDAETFSDENEAGSEP